MTVYVAGAMSLAASSAAAQLISQRDETVTAADGTTFTVTSAIVRVPELRTTADTSRTIDLAVVRARRFGSASSTAHVMLAGGPGDSGVNLVLGMVRQGGSMLADLMNGDLVGIDQRGTGRSSPNLATTTRYELPADRAGSPEAWLPIIEQAVRSVRDDLAARDVRLDAYNTRESADDVDAVRRALGYERISLWGRSYGSHLALATLRRHPNTIERMVIIGPEGPNHTWKLPSLVDAAIERLATRIGQPDLPTLMRQVIDRLTERSATVSLTHPLTGQPTTVAIGAFDLQWVTGQALGDPRAIATLPAAYRQMASGDFTGIAPTVLALRARFGVESAMKHAMDISSGATAERKTQIEHEASQSILGNAMNFPGMLLTDAWNVADLGDDFRQPVRSDVPVLVLAGDLDPRTPVENGREIVATLDNGHLVVVENATHQFDVFGSAAIRRVIERFLRDGAIESDRVTLPPLTIAPQRP